MREIIDSIVQLIKIITSFVLWFWDTVSRFVLWLIDLWDTIGLIVLWTKWTLIAAVALSAALTVRAILIKRREEKDDDVIDQGV